MEIFSEKQLLNSMTYAKPNISKTKKVDFRSTLGAFLQLLLGSIGQTGNIWCIMGAHGTSVMF